MSDRPSNSDADFQTLFESVPGLYLVLDPEWNILAATDAYLQATLIERDDVIGRNVFDVFPDNPDDPASESGRNMRASLGRVIAERTTDVMPLARHDIRLPGSEDEFEERYWSPSNTPVFAADGTLRYVMHHVENVTEFVKLRQDAAEPHADLAVDRMAREIVQRRVEVADASRKLKESNRRLEAQLEQARRLESLGQLAGGVAHDFNNLLGVIINYAAFVNDAVTAAGGGADADWGTLRADVTQIERAAERATGLTRQLLMFARREVVQPRVLDINDIVADVDALLRRTIGEDIALRTALGEGLWTVSADPGQLEQVLLNLAVNARAAMPTGGTLSIDTYNETVDDDYAAGHPGLEPGRYVRLRVSDTGTGMEPTVLDHAFDPFFTTRPVGEGTGLGLATVHGIITQAEGYVAIYSEVGFGTTVSVLLPVAEGTPASVIAAPERNAVGGDETILVVEDHDAMREITRRTLARNGYRVLVASSGAEALAVAGEHGQDIDLLLTDVIMPQILGKELADKMLVYRPRLRVLYMSGYAQPVLASRGTLDEGVELIEKPFAEKALLAKVRELLDPRS